MIIRRNSLVTLQVFYYVPDYKHILNTFVWQTDDIVPEMPRVHRFLNYWKSSIQAVIEEIQVTSAIDGSKLTSANFYRNIS